jgi:hypothetical protein
MALQIDDPLAIGQDWFDANAIPILYPKRTDRLAISLWTLTSGKIQRERLASLRSAANEVSPAFTS